jgi:hypothetical protein
MMMNINWTCTITFALLTVIIYLILCLIIHNKEQKASDMMSMDMMDGMDMKKFLTSCEFLIFVGAAVAFNLNQMFYPPCKM